MDMSPVTYNRRDPEFEWMIEILGVVRTSNSGKAYLIDSEYFSDTVWFPLSQTEIEDCGKGPIYLRATNWIMEAKFNEGDLDRETFYKLANNSTKPKQVSGTHYICPSCGAVHLKEEFKEDTNSLTSVQGEEYLPSHDPDEKELVFSIDDEIPF